MGVRRFGGLEGLAMRRRGRAAGRIAALAIAMMGCGRSGELAEIDRIGRAVDAVRDAPGDAVDAREKLVAELAGQAATLPEAVAARDRCAEAYRLLVDGKRLSARVKSAMKDPASMGPGVLADLVAAEEKVKASAAAMPACDTARAALAKRARP
jgi:hypothetical protein